MKVDIVKPDCAAPVRMLNPSFLRLVSYGYVPHGAMMVRGSAAFGRAYRSSVWQALRRLGDDVVFVEDNSGHIEPALSMVPCGECALCRQSKVIDLVMRAELASYEYSCPPYQFTLTYDAAHLPKYGELVYRDVQLFFKRFRKYCADSYLPTDFKYIVAGEYGTNFGRPHYHVIMFNNPFRCDESMPWLEGAFCWDLWSAWKKCDWKVFNQRPKNFSQVYGGIATYITKYVGKVSRWEDRYIPEAGRKVHRSFIRCSAGLGKSFLSRYKDFYESVDTTRFEYLPTVASRGAAAPSVKSKNMTRSVRRYFHPTPLAALPSKYKDAYKDFREVLYRLVALRRLSFDDASEFMDTLSAGVFSNKMTIEDVPFISMCRTKKDWIAHRLAAVYEHDLDVLSQMPDQSPVIARYHQFKDAQVQHDVGDVAYRLYRAAKTLSINVQKSIF